MQGRCLYDNRRNQAKAWFLLYLRAVRFAFGAGLSAAEQLPSTLNHMPVDAATEKRWSRDAFRERLANRILFSLVVAAPFVWLGAVAIIFINTNK